MGELNDLIKEKGIVPIQYQLTFNHDDCLVIMIDGKEKTIYLIAVRIVTDGNGGFIARYSDAISNCYYELDLIRLFIRYGDKSKNPYLDFKKEQKIIANDTTIGNVLLSQIQKQTEHELEKQKSKKAK